MCSILGYYKLNNKLKVNTSFIKKSLKLMRHRGPDCEKFTICDGNCGLGNQRLKITDLAINNNQPMGNNEYCLVFNGEIYNFLDLKKKMKKNYKFKSNCDTEVLFQGLVNFKLNFLNSLNGMFSAAFYDKKNKELFLIRDRYGVKPLYYTIHSNILYFASELKPLFSLKKKLKKNRKYYKNFIKDSATDYDSQTSVKDIFQVKPGHYVRCSENKKIIEEKWYKFNDYIFDESIFKNKNKTLLFFENLLTDSIKLRIKTDVPVCLTLSGGLDSTVLYTLIKEKLKKKIKIFSLKHDNSSLDESEIVKRLVEKYNDKYYSIAINKSNNIKSLISNIRSLEFPIWDISSVAYSEVYKHININKYKVVIEGHGSDEQLGGYDYLMYSGFLTYFYKLNIKSALQVLNMLNNLIPKSPLLKFFFILENTVKNIFKKFISYNEPFFFNGKLKAAFNYKILPIVLRAFDRLTMKYSIENRCPFLDYRVVEFLRKLPIRYKINSLGSKAILREILKKYGNNFIYENSKKIGFGSDLRDFFKINKQEILKTIHNSDLKESKKKNYTDILKKENISDKNYIFFSKTLQIIIFDKLFNIKNS